MSTEPDRPVEKLLASLQERAKELNCLYEVEQVLGQLDRPIEDAFQAVVEAIPPGWQYPDVCSAQIEHSGRTFACLDFRETPWVLSADIAVQDEIVGRILVVYLEERPREAIGPFLKEEERLIRTIAERLGHAILYQHLRDIRQRWESASDRLREDAVQRWRGPIDLLRRTDRTLYLRVARKMVNHLCSAGIEGAQELLLQTLGTLGASDEAATDSNMPRPSRIIDESPLLSGRPFELAAAYISEDEILGLIQTWIMEDRAAFLPKILNNPRSSLADVSESLRRFHHMVADGAELPAATLNGARVSLIRRFLTENLDFIGVAKQYLTTDDFIDLLDRVILSDASHGKLGGKSAGLFLAQKILERRQSPQRPVGSVKVPRSWYVASEGLTQFIEHNDLEEVLQQKYREIAQVRHEYPNIIQLFKNSRFPGEVVKGVSMLLDDVGDAPLIVRSSSLLEDRLGSAFSGKYKSLFLANRGSKQERMRALLDAITEVYASVFGPDPIAYRRERGLLDFHEEMGILIQEVVGRRVGDYFLPAFAGVAFSTNEFRWSPRIRREDGLVRLVPGLGTRAVDRLTDDYPILAVPRQPALRVNTTIDEVVRYSPRKIDVINLATNRFETLTISELLQRCGTQYPGFDKVFSLLADDSLRRPSALMVDPSRDRLVADFGGLIDSTAFMPHLANTLTILEESLGHPVDIEFATDGEQFYLLQCRPQSRSADDAPAPIPRDLPEETIIFSASRYVANGYVPDLTHIVYVDPEAFRQLERREDFLAVGQAVGALNKLLPKRRFVLMGPGRWGSRGDITLGVSVTYADINNTAMLVEIARRTGNYVPDPSFGTHFFQDLVEASIRYLPLYPDNGEGVLNESFLLRAPNLLPEMLPQFAYLSAVLRVIDVPSASRGRVLRVLLNSELDRAVAHLADPADSPHAVRGPVPDAQRVQREEFWRWRLRMAERIAAELDAVRFGVVALYIFGSTKNASAGPASDIDLLVHFRGDEEQHCTLESWLDGWSLCLGEVNSLRTGYTTERLLDVHMVTDEDIANRTSFAAKIGAITDAARELPLGTPARAE